MEARFRTTFLELYPMGGDAVLAYSPARQRSWTVTTAEAECLRKLRVFRSLDEHGRALGLPDGASVLAEHVHRGLLVTEAEVQARLTGDRATQRPPSTKPRARSPMAAGLSAAVFVSRNRPATLARAMTSAVANAADHGRDLALAIIDDSLDDIARAANAQVASRLAAGGARVHHEAPADRAGFAARLARAADVDEALARFALLGDERCPLATGAARNCALLGHVGQRFLLCDDDVSWSSAAPPQREAGMALSAELDPTRVWFFRDHAELVASASWEDRDLLAAHDLLLGRGLRQIGAAARAATETASAQEQEIDCSRLDSSFEEQLRRCPGRVRVTMAGVAGDSGLGHPDYLGFDRESQVRASVSETFHHQVWQSRQMLRSAVRPTFTRPGALLAMQLGLDATGILPPFVPIQRNSDGNFARVLRLCFPAALVGHLDLCLLHQPPEPRHDSPEQWRAFRQRLRFPNLVASVLEGWSPGARTGSLPAAALRALGRDLVGLTKDSLEAFEQRLRRAVWTREARQAGMLDARSTGAPPFLVARIAEAQALRQQALASPLYIVPRDLERDGDVEGARQLNRELFRSFGRLLCAWPRLWRAARRLRAKGEGLIPSEEPNQ